MKRLITLLACYVLPATLMAQQGYWQQQVNYNIHVQLNDQLHSLSGQLSLEYKNQSPDTLTYIWFHLWPNAYKNDQTALARQLAEDKKGKKQLKATPGFIDSLAFRVNGQSVKTQADQANIDELKVMLLQPLLPGQQVTITTPFYVKLPSYYSRSGYAGQQYMICQWYPKPAVYDARGWHVFPYLDQGEFYSEFGRFKVTITLPAEYVVGATGTLQTKEELEQYKITGAANYSGSNTKARYRPGRQPFKTLEYVADSVHDFAWFAGKDLVIHYDTLQLSSGKVVDAFTYFHPNSNKQWINSLFFVKDAVHHYSAWIGEYPYPVVQAVEGPENNSSGGMEYPMITLITSPNAGKEELDGVIAHEVGHNWFYGILGSNERDNPWMDEGINSFYQFRYEAEKYRGNSIFGKMLPADIRKLPEEEFLTRVYVALNALPAKEPVNTGSTAFSNKADYGIVVYVKTAIWMYILEKNLGREGLDRAMQSYFQQWKFRHPAPENLKAVMEKVNGIALDQQFDLLNKEGNF